ncbi:MAG TPA: hypothetical protein PLR63_08155 [Paludibacteraceae bacterium]|nr:hypothetical protein [Paludibacteraceae bacterium]
MNTPFNTMLNTSDRVCLISVDKYEVNDDGDVVKTGSETLTDYYKIELYLHTRKTPTAFAKYSIADPLPAGYLQMTITNNKLEFTIRREDVARFKDDDIVYYVSLWAEDERYDGEDLRKDTLPMFLVAVKSVENV